MTTGMGIVAVIWIVCAIVISRMSYSHGKFTGHQNGWREGVERGFKDYLRNMKTVVETAVKEKDALKAQSCAKECGGRKPDSDFAKEKMMRAGYKYYLELEKAKKIAEDEALIIKMQESKEMVEPLEDEPCDCGDGCGKCAEAQDEQDSIEAIEEVKENNKEAAESVLKFDGNGEHTTYIPGDLSQVNENHRTADEKVLKSIKKACEESIDNVPPSTHSG